jgi:hypothetical protein
MRGSDPSLMKDELLWMIGEHIDAHPRSAQIRIGPSELGTPCPRRIAYKLNGTEAANPRKGAWKPTVGTAVHAWLEQALTIYNEGVPVPRFYLEQTVTVGTVGGVEITGNCDCYDRMTATVIDWKVVGLAGLKRYRLDGPGEQYRAQAHLYGRGFVNAGLPVDHVAVMFLPQNGELRDAHYWTEPYDEQVALDALNRADGISTLVAALGPRAAAALPTADAFCDYCPWYLAGATDPAEACRGHTPTDATGTPPVEPAAPAA